MSLAMTTTSRTIPDPPYIRIDVEGIFGGSIYVRGYLNGHDQPFEKKEFPIPESLRWGNGTIGTKYVWSDDRTASICIYLDDVEDLTPEGTPDEMPAGPLLRLHLFNEFDLDEFTDMKIRGKFILTEVDADGKETWQFDSSEDTYRMPNKPR